MIAPRLLRPSRPPRAAFTLIELLTVLAVISILAAILIPVTGQVRRAARMAQSASNLKTIGQAVQLYLADNRSKFPPLGQGTGFTPPLWTDSGLGYPEWRKGLNTYLPTSGRSRFTSFSGGLYSINEVYVDPLLADDRHHSAGDYGASRAIFRPDGQELALSQVPQPSRTVLVAAGETTTVSPPVGSWFIETNNWANGVAVSNQPGDRGTGKVPVVFVDGHVEQLSRGRLETDQEYRRSLFLPNP